jgi:predicted transcriptional regulator|nr:MAG TPA: hypothetical protein [Caudoviricetes sp.]
MKNILIAIRPKWVEKIASGQKTIEVRKTAPKETPFKAYIYATRPKKFYKCGAVSTSDELLWLANGKVEMGDGFKFWADGDEYQCLNGFVIGEFICDKVYNLVNAFGGIMFADENLNQLEPQLFRDMSCLTDEQTADYLGNKDGYGWHISNLKIYDKPRELSEFYRICKNPCKPSNGGILCLTTKSLKMNGCDGKIPLTRPPQSYMFVEEVEQ